MRNPLYNDEFEDYLQQQVKQHRMYPSDHIWRNIQDNLHGNTRWPALTFISIFIIVSLVIGTLVMKPNKQVYTAAVAPSLINEKVKTQIAKAPQEVLADHLAPENITQITIASVSQKIANQTTVAIATATVGANTIITNIADEQANLASLTANTQQTNASPVLSTVGTTNTKNFLPHLLTPFNNSFLINLNSKEIAYSANASSNNNASSLNSDAEIWRAFAVTNSSKLVPKLPKFDFQFYVTPSISYRRLVDEKTGGSARPFIGIPASANYIIDVNQVVRHKPSMGVEVGFAIGYKLNKRLTIKTGLQFNMREYNIEAYQYNTEPAAVALSGNNSPDTLNTFSNYRNYPASSTPIVLSNTYYEISLPVGVDYRIISSGKFGFNIAAAIQPTYTFDKEPFIITSDYKNYADGSAIMRNWNLNTNFETYVSYQMGNFRWQIGPQFRYQQLPTYSNKYPIREYLLDYGVKIGFTKTIK